MSDRRIAILAEEYRRQRESLLAAYPELAEDEAALADTLDGITDAGDFIASFARLAREDEAMAKALSAMQADMAERKSRFEARAEKRRSVALALMNAIGERKIIRPDLTITIQPGRPAVRVTDEAQLPDAYFRVTKVPDKSAIRESIERGEPVPGAVLSNREETLTIRSK
jgi:hypothetical protein